MHPVSYNLAGSKHESLRLQLPENTLDRRGSGYNIAVAELPDSRRVKLGIYRTGGNPSLASVLFDEEFVADHSTARLLPLKGHNDPRLIWWRDQLILVTSYKVAAGERIEVRKLALDANGHTGIEVLGQFQTIENWPGYAFKREKNWVPFVQDGELHLVYSMAPHRVLKFDPATKSVRMVAEEYWAFPKPWLPEFIRHDLRFNTNPVLLQDGSYLSTFHVCTNHGSGNYYNGFYTFDSSFKVTRVCGKFATVAADATGRNPRNPRSGCLFFQTLLLDEERDLVQLIGGDNDHSSIVVRIKLSDVINDLIPVEQLARITPSGSIAACSNAPTHR